MFFLGSLSQTNAGPLIAGHGFDSANEDNLRKDMAAAVSMEELGIETMEEGGLYDKRRRYRRGKRGRGRSTGVAGIVEGAEHGASRMGCAGVVQCVLACRPQSCNCCMQSPSTTTWTSSAKTSRTKKLRMVNDLLRRQRKPGQL